MPARPRVSGAAQPYARVHHSPEPLGARAEVEVALDPPPRPVPEPSSQRRIAEHRLDRAGEGDRVARPGPAARSRPVSPRSRSRATSLATTGRAQAIASRTTFGQPVAIPGGVDDGRHDDEVSRCVLARQLRVRARPAELDPAAEARVRDRAARAPRARGPRPRSAAGTGRSTRAAASTSTSNPFFATSRPTASTVAGPGPARNLGGAEPLEVDAVRDQVNLLSALAELGDHVRVARDHARRAHGSAGRAPPGASFRASRAWTLNP